MVTKAQKIRLGIFLAIGSFLLILFIGAVAGSRIVQKRDIYYIEFADYSISGMQVGGPVNYSGIRIGRVDAIKIDLEDVSKIVLTISVEAGTPIKEDAEAVLVPVGITGLKAVEIRGGTNESPNRKQRTFIPTGTSMFDDITGKAVSIADKIDIIAANIGDMTGEENRKNIAEILHQTALLLEETRSTMTTTLVSLDRIAKNAADIAESANQNLGKVTDSLTDNMDKLTNSTTDNISALTQSTTQNIDRLTTTSTASIEGIAKQLSGEIKMLSSNLNQSISDINEQTTYLLQDTRFHINAIGSHSDLMILETTKQIMEVSENINKSVSRVNQLISSPAFDSLFTNVNTLSAQLAEANLKDLVTNISVTIQRTSSLISNLDRTIMRNRSSITETLESLRETSENLSDFSKQIADDPSILIRGY